MADEQNPIPAPLRNPLIPIGLLGLGLLAFWMWTRKQPTIRRQKTRRKARSESR